jgi:hypothetical protein
MTKPKKPVQEWIVEIKVKGPKPDVRVLCNDTIFLSMVEGQTASFTVKKKKKP